MSLMTSLESSGVEFKGVFAFLASRASQEFAAHAVLCRFSADPPIIEEKGSGKGPIVYIQFICIQKQQPVNNAALHETSIN